MVYHRGMMIPNAEVARLLGLSKSAVSMLRSGRRSPSIDTMERVAEVYGWTVADQFEAKRGGWYAAELTRRTRIVDPE